MSSDCGALLLGGGVSRRFGADKRLHPLGDTFVAAQTLQRYHSAFDQVCVVLRAEDEEIKARLTRCAPNTQFVHAAEAALGMGHSLAAGVAAVHWQWLFVGLLDMPFVEPATLQHLQNARHQADVIIRPHVAHGPDLIYGHPIGFHHSLREELLSLSGDAGARGVLQHRVSSITHIRVNDPGIYTDIDTEADLPSA